ncbi:MAG: FtsX-like permease family protein, partial [Sphingomonadales bacterium]
ETPDKAIGQTIYQYTSGEESSPLVIAGVAEDANFLAFHNKLKPFIYRVEPSQFSNILIKYDPAQQAQADAGVETAWNQVLPEFPILKSSLDAAFDDVFAIFSGISNALLGFSLMALLIATIGLFGLSAFMAERRIREVGIRKTFGASTSRIVRLLTFQFSRPVIWALVFALPAAYFAQNELLSFFADPISEEISFYLVFLFGGVFSLLLAWVTVGANAYRAANSKPVDSLHYE